ncbi:MAG: hypothetical protein PHF61_11620, partial [Bacteroidales bacterium]|nr:hypothetical protein [Bacteroidales bacterium]
TTRRLLAPEPSSSDSLFSETANDVFINDFDKINYLPWPAIEGLLPLSNFPDQETLLITARLRANYPRCFT